MSDDWRERALCAQVGGEAWFPEKGQPARPSKKICAACPVAVQCLEWTLTLPKGDDQFGIIAGLSVAERNRLRAAA
jgi:WhiB family transcriptional regulator, redox-sensing transcriptional regulator